jgi:hypothetical protein
MNNYTNGNRYYTAALRTFLWKNLPDYTASDPDSDKRWAMVEVL